MIDISNYIEKFYILHGLLLIAVLFLIFVVIWFFRHKEKEKLIGGLSTLLASMLASVSFIYLVGKQIEIQNKMLSVQKMMPMTNYIYSTGKGLALEEVIDVIRKGQDVAFYATKEAANDNYSEEVKGNIVKKLSSPREKLNSHKGLFDKLGIEDTYRSIEECIDINMDNISRYLPSYCHGKLQAAEAELYQKLEASLTK